MRIYYLLTLLLRISAQSLLRPRSRRYPIIQLKRHAMRPVQEAIIYLSINPEQNICSGCAQAFQTQTIQAMRLPIFMNVLVAPSIYTHPSCGFAHKV